MPATGKKKKKQPIPQFKWLKKNWENVRQAGGLSSLTEFARSRKNAFDLNELEHELSKIELFSRYRRQRRRYKRPKIIINGPHQYYCTDLIVMGDLAWHNGNHSYILLLKDMFSKRISLVAQKFKTGADTARALEKALKLLSRGGRKYARKLNSDMGLEYWNKEVKAVLKKYNIHHYAVKTNQKASMCENAVRRVKSYLYKHMSVMNTKRWIDILPEVARRINTTVSDAHGYKPDDVNDSNAEEVFSRLYGKLLQKKRKPARYTVGQKVRISGNRLTFQKGYKHLYSPMVFEITKVLDTYPVFSFRLKDPSGKELDTSFVAEELSPVTDPDDDNGTSQ